MDKEQLKQFKEEVLRSKEGKEMIADKVVEIQNEIVLLRKTIRELEVKNTTKSDDEKWFIDWLVEQWTKDLRRRDSELRRWQYRAHPQAYAKQETFDIEALKSIPISAIMEREPSYRSPTRDTYLCPIHDEKTASAMWDKKRNRLHCFGCGFDEDVIGLYMAMHGVDFKDASKQLTNYL